MRVESKPRACVRASNVCVCGMLITSTVLHTATLEAGPGGNVGGEAWRARVTILCFFKTFRLTGTVVSLLLYCALY